jgi:hypothetical protein
MASALNVVCRGDRRRGEGPCPALRVPWNGPASAAGGALAVFTFGSTVSANSDLLDLPRLLPATLSVVFGSRARVPPAVWPHIAAAQRTGGVCQNLPSP